MDVGTPDFRFNWAGIVLLSSFRLFRWFVCDPGGQMEYKTTRDGVRRQNGIITAIGTHWFGNVDNKYSTSDHSEAKKICDRPLDRRHRVDCSTL
jgi:hypothetical protein